MAKIPSPRHRVGQPRVKPDFRPDWKYWSKLPKVAIWEAWLLSRDKDPRTVKTHPPMWRAVPGDVVLISEEDLPADVLRLMVDNIWPEGALRCADDGRPSIHRKVRLGVFGRWATIEMEWLLPPEFPVDAEASGQAANEPAETSLGPANRVIRAGADLSGKNERSDAIAPFIDEAIEAAGGLGESWRQNEPVWRALVRMAKNPAADSVLTGYRTSPHEVLYRENGEECSLPRKAFGERLNRLRKKGGEDRPVAPRSR